MSEVTILDFIDFFVQVNDDEGYVYAVTSEYVYHAGSLTETLLYRTSVLRNSRILRGLPRDITG